MDTVDVIDQAYREGVRGAYLAGIGAVVVQQAQRDRDEEDRATGAAFRRLVESGSRFNVERVWADQPWEVWVYDRREHPSYGKTFEEAVNAALGAEPGADA